MILDNHVQRALILLATILITIPSISSAHKLKPQEITYLKGTIQFKGRIYSPLKVDELNYSYYGIPENYYKLETTSDYTIGEDQYGNKKLTLNFEDVLEKNIDVEINFESRSKFGFPENIDYPYDPPRDVVKYLEEGNKTIITERVREISRNLIGNSKSSFEVVSRLTRWVNKNLVYDESYGNTAKSANWVLRNKRGTCDEFATLLISMLRSSGIPSRYVAGAVYSKEGWGYHGWVEVYLDKWIPTDPTWNEVGWIDATHIPFGRFKDPSEVDVGIEYKSFRNIGSSIKFKAPEVNVRIDSEVDGNEILDLRTYSYPTKIAPGKSSVIEMVFEKEREGCIFTTAHIISRLMKTGKTSFKKREIPVDICRKTKRNYFIISPKNLNENYIYRNIGDIKSSLSNAETLDLEINPKIEADGNLEVELEKSKAMIGEEVKINVISDNNYRIFSELDVEDGHIKAEGVGNFKITVATETGEVREKNLEVTKSLDFQVKNISFPKNITCGNNATILIELENLGKKTELPLVFNTKEDVIIQNKNITLEEGSKIVRTTIRTGERCDVGERIIHFRISDKYYNQKMELFKKEREEKIIEGIFKILTSFFTRIQGFFSKSLQP